MRVPSLLLVVSLLWSGLMDAVPGQEPVSDAFESHEVEVEGARYPYRLLTPRPDQRAAARPLVVFLHGAGERGDDNARQLTWLPERMAEPAMRERHPCYLLAVQCPNEERWVEVDWGLQEPQPMPAEPSRAMRAVMLAMDEVLQRDGVDPARVYLTGLSMGGYGAWDLAGRRTETFAAVLTVCGGGDPARAGELCGLPVQVWHGAADPVVPVAQSRAMVAAFGARAMPLQYFELEGVQHDAWRQAYGDEGGLDWLFAQDQRQQRRGRWAELPVVPRLVPADLGDGRFRLAGGARVHVPDELRRLASFLLDELELPATDRPSLVAEGKVADGDLALVLDGELQHAFELDVGAALRVRARGVREMADATAAVFQALRAGGGRGVPFGRYHLPQSAEAPVDQLVVDVGSPDWSRGALRALLRECWLGSVDEVFFVRDPTRHDPAAWREFTVLVDRVGVVLRSDRPDAGDRLVVTSAHAPDDVLLREAKAPGYAATVVGATPSGIVTSARALLPAALERSRRSGGPVHAAGFYARMIGRWR